MLATRILASVERMVVEVGQIDGQEHPAGDDVARVGVGIDHTHRGAGAGLVSVADMVLAMAAYKYRSAMTPHLRPSLAEL